MMKIVLKITSVGVALAASTIAHAQTLGSSPGNSMVVRPPATTVDGGINAKGAPKQQSPASDVNGAPVKLPSANASSSAGVNLSGASQTDTPVSGNNALTKSPKGPGSGGNDATK